MIGAIIATVSLINIEAIKPKPTWMKNKRCFPVFVFLSKVLAAFSSVPLISRAVTITNIPKRKTKTSASEANADTAFSAFPGLDRTIMTAATKNATHAGTCIFPILLKIIARLTKKRRMRGKIWSNVIMFFPPAVKYTILI